MIYGIGVDQVDLNRVRKLLKKSQTKFEKRCFTQNEIIYANRFNDPAKRLGARFAAKESESRCIHYKVFGRKSRLVPLGHPYN